MDGGKRQNPSSQAVRSPRLQEGTQTKHNRSYTFPVPYTEDSVTQLWPWGVRRTASNFYKTAGKGGACPSLRVFSFLLLEDKWDAESLTEQPAVATRGKPSTEERPPHGQRGHA